MPKQKMDNILSRVKDLEDTKTRERLSARIPESFTATEYAESVGISPITATARLRKLVDSGTLRRVKVPVLDSLGNVVHRHGYIIVEATSDKKSK